MRVLLIEDSARLRELVSEAVRDAGWKIDAFATAELGRSALADRDYDLLLLDLGLPDEDGIDVLKSLRAAKMQIPVLVLTARGAIDERIVGLDAGADDYLAKPFHNGELIARIRALMRRAPATLMPVLEYGCLQMDVASRRVTCSGAEIALAPSEKGLLELLMRNGGKVVAKARIEHAFSEFGDERSSNAVELAVSRLRKKMDGHQTETSIETIRGVGYMMREVLV
ncbi:response regulator transcription factor [Rhizobium pusense]|uniref:Response regulator transcription factor n=1 Tax=Agrobacterium pusense TaxID=648995 RepID=A0A6H0ZG69_9HYPH|nr:response regulator transcription factor [Agrobacterium pusense]QCM13943.1 response regulator transcription factor [Agrobacterium tumefaciens]HCD84326.1 DNA-binding response regulator [Agrobacterium sp.]MDH2092117.1 response regulator transcription factor [Agrobacterium pusense]QIX19805.1 response regulator transcription factor [Agrobacterium pusense]WCK27586.1 response regulator transcription factor [Agrobacterium pusense]